MIPNLDDIMLWPDGSWMFAGEFCWEVDNWRGDDYEILPEYSTDWNNLLIKEGEL